jgi:hypothetical protein
MYDEIDDQILKRHPQVVVAFAVYPPWFTEEDDSGNKKNGK